MRRLLGWLVGALVAGLAIGLVKGDGDLLRGELGNLSAPWLLVALVPGWFVPSWWRAALLGTATTLIGLIGFYAGMTWFVHDHLGFHDDLWGYFRFLVRANRTWFTAGLVSGPVCGAVAGWLGLRLRTTWLGLLVGLALAGEYPILRIVRGVRLPLVPASWGGGGLTVAQFEAVLGAVVLVGTALLLGRRRAA